MLKFVLLATVAGGLSMLPASAQETPFAKPSSDYLRQFASDGQRTFVYERYDANGQLYARDIEPLASFSVDSATERTINGVQYRLRGLTACPTPTVTYQTEEWQCNEAAADAQNMIYQERAKVVLCKTLMLESEPDNPDPVSCFSLVGDGTSNDPYAVTYDDDDMVFLGFAAIKTNDQGESLRPDLEHTQQLGKKLGMSDDR